MPDPPLIELRDASVMRGLRLALRDISLRIEVREHVAILGPNGCGKSTLVKTLTRECYPLARSCMAVRIFGRESWDVFELRSLLGIVSNDFQTHGREVTGREMVLSGFFSSVGVWPHQSITASMEEKAAWILDFLSVSHLADRDYTEMSSGEARRLLIARALVHEPKALLLDEPTTSLDLAAQHDLRESMRRLARSGVGILLVTHQLSDIIPEIERVILMKDGRILKDGPKPELLRREPIAKLFGVNVDIAEREGYFHAW
jgi:iron complex transport system ATP-binding protein